MRLLKSIEEYPFYSLYIFLLCLTGAYALGEAPSKDLPLLTVEQKEGSVFIVNTLWAASSAGVVWAAISALCAVWWFIRPAIKMEW